MTLPRPLVVSKTGGSLRRPSSVVSGRLHSSRSHQCASSPALAGILVEDGARDMDRGELAVEESFRLRPRGPLLAAERVLVLRVAADACTSSPRLRPFRPSPCRRRDIGPLTIGLGELSRVIIEIDSTPPPIDRVGAFVHDHVRGLRDRLKTGRAEAVHREARRRHRQAGAQRRDARDVVPLHTVRLTAAQDHVLDFSRDRARALSARRCRMTCAASSSGRVMLNDPRCDLASGVRWLATMTASLKAPCPPRPVVSHEDTKPTNSLIGNASCSSWLRDSQSADYKMYGRSRKAVETTTKLTTNNSAR